MTSPPPYAAGSLRVHPCFLALLWLVLTPVAAGADTVLARGGRALAVIAVAEDPIPSEVTAARELRRYLEEVTGASFAEGNRGPLVIHVGPTRLVRELGLGPERLGPEEWVIRTVEGGLVLTGGRPRGTLYAVYRFLEEHVGVRWWTPWDESVPARQTLRVASIDERKAPAFVYRDIHGVVGPRAFLARNRVNGHFSWLNPAFGGTEAYGPPNPAHSFANYASPGQYFDQRPELFSEIDGRRVSEDTQLCLTNEDLLDLVTGKMLRNIEEGTAEARRRGASPPALYEFSQNDWGNPCCCSECAWLAAVHGGDSAPIVAFVNRLAERIGRAHPRILIDTLAYYYSFDPPRGLELRDNVAVRLSALQYRDFSRPVTDPANAAFRGAIDGWRSVAQHLRIWDYSVTFGSGKGLPLPNASFLGEDYRYYLEHGVEGVFIQHDHPIVSDLRDLKLWMLTKLLEDPYRRETDLIREFTTGYYGAGGSAIRRWIETLRDAARDSSAFVGYPVKQEQFRYLDLETLERGHRLFDRAEHHVADDPEMLRRVRFARLSLDRATLLRLDELRADWRSQGRRSGKAPIDVPTLIERYRDTRSTEIDRRLPEGGRAAARDAMRLEIRRVTKRFKP